MPQNAPAIVVLSSLFPSPVRPGAGLFVRERMFRVGQQLPLTVISPQPWSPLDGLIRRLRPHYRPPCPLEDQQQGIQVHYPRFLSLPGLARWLDGWSMARAALPLVRELAAAGRCELIDSHFAYPDGFAATRLGRRLRLPVTITLRGTEPRTAGYPWRGRLQRRALRAADKVFAVADSLRRLALRQGVPEARTRVVGNGVDVEKFQPVDRAAARRELGLPADAPVLISVGGLVERKGFHRVIELLPALRQQYPQLQYLVVGGGGPEGDWSARLQEQVARLGLQDTVRFLGPWPPERLKVPLSAADLFVLATSNEGWANVFLEAMACGLPVVTTDVGGNAEVVSGAALGTVVPFGDAAALQAAIAAALARDWDRAAIRRHAEDNDWDGRVAILVAEFRALGADRHGAAMR
jgi:glycosyltransferase involved in cell wall biosynthesis